MSSIGRLPLVTPADQIHLEVGRLQAQDLIGPTAAHEGPDAGQKFREGKRLHEVVVRTAVEPEHPVLDRIPGRQNENRRAEAASPQGRQDLDAVAAGKHQVEHDQIECLGVHTKEAVLARCRDDDLVVFRLEAFLQSPCYLGFVFDDEDPHEKLTTRHYAETTTPAPGPS